MVVDQIKYLLSEMKVHHLKYLSVYSVPLIVFVSLYLEGWWTFSTLIYLFVFIPLAELFTQGSTKNMTAIEEELAKEDKFYDYLLYGLVPIQIIILFYFLVQVNQPHLALYEIVGMITTYGMACGIAINNAHELGHRVSTKERFMSKLLLLTSLYMHFYIEHNRGHHKNVATPEDPSSGRIGENIYSFYFRTVLGSWISAWKLERKRLQKSKIPFWSYKNEMLRFQILQLTLIILIGANFGYWTMLYFILGASIGFLLLETVNYIEHYGLHRKKNGSRYERTLPIHSWNSNHPLGRLILLELSRHSDHHYMASRKYQILRHFDESPQMPTGYPGMMLLALIPPLWFPVMHKRIDQYKKTMHGKNLG